MIFSASSGRQPFRFSRPSRSRPATADEAHVVDLEEDLGDDQSQNGGGSNSGSSDSTALSANGPSAIVQFEWTDADLETPNTSLDQ